MDVVARVKDLENRTDQIEEQFKAAFPNEDHISHCRYHQLMIEEIEGRKRLRQAVLEKSVISLVWALVLVVGAAMWTYLIALVKAAIGKMP